MQDKNAGITRLMRVVEELREAGFTIAEIRAMATAAALELEQYGEPGTYRRREADQGERENFEDRVLRRRLQERIAASMYPGHGAYLDQVERAVVLVACGMGDVTLVLGGGREESAAMVVTVLGLEDIVNERVSYRHN